jgi:Ca2+/H+ antiporter, TMEM165/GDT1 family
MLDLGTWGYVGVFLAAATPWLEILLVIPAGVAVGLDAVPVGVVAFLGNALPVTGIVLAHDAAQRWRIRRRQRRGGQARAVPSPRTERARRIMRRYGLPVLALAGPLVTGIHVATAIALALGARRLAVVWWMTASLALWTVVVTALAAAGVALVRG